MAVCTGFIEPLNLECILVNMFSGNIAIFAAISFIMVAALAARFKMPNGIALMMMALFVILFANLFLPIYLLVILMIGIFTFTGVARLAK